MVARLVPAAPHPAAGPAPSGTSEGNLGWGALTAALDILGIRPSSTTTTLPMFVGTTTATTMAFAFAIFGKKRRDEEAPAPDEVLQAQAARGHSAVLGGAVVGAMAAAVPPPVDIEAGMPRWRRPSVQAARKSDPTRYVESGRMSFDHGSVDAVDGHETRVIRYRVVRLLDAPDELRGVDIGQLDQGDEVQLLERSGAYWLVLCPDGRQGWLHKMTLGEPIKEETAQADVVDRRRRRRPRRLPRREGARLTSGCRAWTPLDCVAGCAARSRAFEPARSAAPRRLASDAQGATNAVELLPAVAPGAHGVR